MLATERMTIKNVRIDEDCSKCGLCVAICPIENFTLDDGKITHNHNCTMCYRCINKCPKKAINVVFKGKVKKQYSGVNYLRP